MLHSYNYLGDGTNKDFDINYVPLSQKDVWVKVHGTILSHSEFTVDYQNKKLKLTTAPGDKQQVHIITMSNNGEKILDVDQFIGDGSTAQFVTSIPFKSTLSFFLTVDGVTTNVDMAETDGTYAQKGMCVFKLGTAPLNSTVIQYAIFDSASKMLTAALQAKEAKMTKKMKMIELQMRQARLIKDSEKIDAYVQARRREAGLDEEEIAEGRIIGDRTAMLAEIMKNLPENDK